MSGILDGLALGLGYFMLWGVALLLVTFVATLVTDAVKPRQKPQKPITAARLCPCGCGYSGCLYAEAPAKHPHPLHHAVRKVHAQDGASAWTALEKAS